MHGRINILSSSELKISKSNLRVVLFCFFKFIFREMSDVMYTESLKVRSLSTASFLPE